MEEELKSLKEQNKRLKQRVYTQDRPTRDLRPRSGLKKSTFPFVSPKLIHADPETILETSREILNSKSGHSYSSLKSPRKESCEVLHEETPKPALPGSKVNSPIKSNLRHDITEDPSVEWVQHANPGKSNPEPSSQGPSPTKIPTLIQETVKKSMFPFAPNFVPSNGPFTPAKLPVEPSLDPWYVCLTWWCDHGLPCAQ
jgi:hypothetical protein